ncbi:Thymidine kinase [Eptesicus fuscus gammaherpesvirus]|uniref:Thymidine kinase n=1 Tax=vespertilionid gammaherpesvirus 3 TaxID=2846598 RepID=A0A2D1A3F7_9GAMA|nr:Thymidine kinase [Eptesicus fuscus gammaherpesvirus]ATA58250.1 Thymidine kinase [Eptesicus fuscus gammaherpesvirus]WAH70895.1 thymidine kinase [Eptesicus fuscus gammaherpesvirus]
MSKSGGKKAHQRGRHPPLLPPCDYGGAEAFEAESGAYSVVDLSGRFGGRETRAGSSASASRGRPRFRAHDRDEPAPLRSVGGNARTGGGAEWDSLAHSDFTVISRGTPPPSHPPPPVPGTGTEDDAAESLSSWRHGPRGTRTPRNFTCGDALYNVPARGRSRFPRENEHRGPRDEECAYSEAYSRPRPPPGAKAGAGGDDDSTSFEVLSAPSSCSGGAEGGDHGARREALDAFSTSEGEPEHVYALLEKPARAPKTPTRAQYAGPPPPPLPPPRKPPRAALLRSASSAASGEYETTFSSGGGSSGRNTARSLRSGGYGNADLMLPANAPADGGRRRGRSATRAGPPKLLRDSRAISQDRRRRAAKNLQGSLGCLLNIGGGSSGDEGEDESPVRLIPIGLLRPSPDPEYARVCRVFIEGSMGVGKTTLISSVSSMLGSDVALAFGEPMDYWRGVFSDCIEKVNKTLKSAASGGSGRSARSISLLACQTKFLTPLAAIQTAVRRFRHPDDGREVDLSPLDRWCLFDRHPLSAAVIFPLTHAKRGILTVEHLFGLLAAFRAHRGDVVVLLQGPPWKNYQRVKGRNRKAEDAVTASYLEDMADAYSMFYCTWLLLQYFAPEVIVELCVGVRHIADACANASTRPVQEALASRLNAKSMIPLLAEVIQPFRADCVVLEVCLRFFREVRKLQCVTVDIAPFEGDVQGLWSTVYSQVLQQPAIKTHLYDWGALRCLAHKFSAA